MTMSLEPAIPAVGLSEPHAIAARFALIEAERLRNHAMRLDSTGRREAGKPYWQDFAQATRVYRLLVEREQSTWVRTAPAARCAVRVAPRAVKLCRVRGLPPALVSACASRVPGRLWPPCCEHPVEHTRARAQAIYAQCATLVYGEKSTSSDN